MYRKDRKISGDDKENYWKERTDLLIYEKKKWIVERKEFRDRINKLESANNMLQQKNKVLQNTVLRMGEFDK